MVQRRWAEVSRPTDHIDTQGAPSAMTSQPAPVKTIDISEGRDRTVVAADMVASFRDVGFAYLTGHGVSAETVSTTFEASRLLFASSPEELDDIHFRHAGRYRGYVPPDGRRGKGRGYELFDCAMTPGGEYRGPGAAYRDAPNLWPAALPDFRPALENYQQHMRVVAERVLSLIAEGLGLSPSFFAERSRLSHGQLRLLHYLCRPDARPGAVSAGQHVDYEAVTLLAQDDVGGLQIRAPGGGWCDVPPVPGAILVNSGEQLGRWTNGVIPATLHRVLAPRTGERFSIAFFYTTGYDVPIEPALPAADPYDVITGGEYIEKYFADEGI